MKFLMYRVAEQSPSEKRALWIGNSLNSVQASKKFGKAWNDDDSDSDSSSRYHAGPSSRKIEPAADPKIKVFFFIYGVVITVSILKSWLVVQNLSIAFSSVFIFFEAFRLTLVKKNRQNEKSSVARSKI